MPKDKPISEALKDSPYKEHVLPFLTMNTVYGCNSICKALDRLNNIPSEKNGKPNPDSWENKLMEVGELFGKYQKTTNPETKFKLDVVGMEKYAAVLEGDTSKLEKKAAEFFRDLSEEYKKTCEKNAGNQTFKAFKSIMDMTMLPAEYDQGDYLRAMADNPYLYHLQSQVPGGPNFADRSLDELYENLAKEPGKDEKKTEPLGMMNEYFRCTTELFKREYEKQKMVDNGYTPEQEKKYLDDLKRDMKDTLDNFDKMYRFSEQHPDAYKEGKYLGSDFDHITGAAMNHTRDAGSSMGNIRGQLGAIENGWGMEELSPFGALGELKTTLEKTARRSDYDIELCEHKIETDKKNLENEKNEIRKNRIQSSYEEHLKELDKLKGKKEQSAALLNDMKELDDTVINKKVSTAADKAEVLNTLMLFVNEKSKAYPLTDIDNIFNKQQKALVNESVEKVNGDLREKMPRVQANIKEKKQLPKSIVEMHKGTEYESCAAYYYSNDLLSNSNMFTAILDRENRKAGKDVESWKDKSESIAVDIQTFKQQVNNDKTFKYKYLNDSAKHNVELLKDPSEEEGIDPKAFDKEVTEYANGLTARYKEFCEENKNNKDFQAVKNILDVTMLSADLSKGSIFKAESENPYLYVLKMANNAIPNFHSVPLSEIRQALDGPVDPVTKKETKPLRLMNDYFGGVYDLYMLEYEKQGMTKEDRTPEKENDYLGRLRTTMKATIDSFEKMKDFEKEHPGEFKKGKYLPNDFDHTMGVDPENNRHSGYAIGQLKGQVKAIDNGWGMDELVHLGTLGELKSRLEHTIRRSSSRIEKNQESLEDYRKKLPNAKDEDEKNHIEEEMQKCEKTLREEPPKKNDSSALLRDMSELDEVMNKKVNSPADKMEAIIKISEFAEKKAKEYPNSEIGAVFNTEMKTLLNDSREKVFGQLQMDNAIKTLEDGQKGVFFGKKDYDKVLKDMRALNEMYKANKEAVFAGDKAAVTPEIKAKEQEVLSGMAAYKSRKEDEFAKNAAAGKEDNANSRKRYHAMDKAMNDLLARVEFNNRLEKGFPPEIEAPQEKAVLIPDEHQAKAPEAAEPKKAEAPKAEEPKAEAIKAEAPRDRPVINEETERYLTALKEQATSARGVIRDSAEYLGFLSSIDKVTDITRSINQSRKKNRILDEDAAYKHYAEAVHEMQTRAKDYEDYKLSDHTENPKADTKMKKLNSTDKEKLDIVRSVMHNNRYFNIGEPIVPLTDRRLSGAQEKIRAAKNGLEEGEYPDRKGLEAQYAAVAAANLIQTKQKHGQMMHVSAAQFDSAVEKFKKMPAFVKNMEESSDKTMYEHATDKKGQLLFEDISKAHKTVKAQEEIQNSTRTEFNKTINKQKTMN